MQIAPAIVPGCAAPPGARNWAPRPPRTTHTTYSTTASMFSFAKKWVDKLEGGHSAPSADSYFRANLNINNLGYALRILHVHPQSTAHDLGFEAWFDYIVGVNGHDLPMKVPLSSNSYAVNDDGSVNYGDAAAKEASLVDFDLVAQELASIAASPNKHVSLTVWSAKGGVMRTLDLHLQPPTAANPPGSPFPLYRDCFAEIGLTVQSQHLTTATHVWRILKSHANSPAFKAQLVPYSDYIIGCDSAFHTDEAGKGLLARGGESLLSRTIQGYYAYHYETLQDDNIPITLHVYNHDYDVVRPVTVYLSKAWSPDQSRGYLGCDVGYGLLHRLPKIPGKFASANTALSSSALSSPVRPPAAPRPAPPIAPSFQMPSNSADSHPASPAPASSKAAPSNPFESTQAPVIGMQPYLPDMFSTETATATHMNDNSKPSEKPEAVREQAPVPHAFGSFPSQSFTEAASPFHDSLDDGEDFFASLSKQNTATQKSGVGNFGSSAPENPVSDVAIPEPAINNNMSSFPDTPESRAPESSAESHAPERSDSDSLTTEPLVKPSPAAEVSAQEEDLNSVTENIGHISFESLKPEEITQQTESRDLGDFAEERLSEEGATVSHNLSETSSPDNPVENIDEEGLKKKDSNEKDLHQEDLYGNNLHEEDLNEVISSVADEKQELIESGVSKPAPAEATLLMDDDFLGGSADEGFLDDSPYDVPAAKSVPTPEAGEKEPESQPQEETDMQEILLDEEPTPHPPRPAHAVQPPYTVQSVNPPQPPHSAKPEQHSQPASNPIEPGPLTKTSPFVQSQFAPSPFASSTSQSQPENLPALTPTQPQPSDLISPPKGGRRKRAHVPANLGSLTDFMNEELSKSKKNDVQYGTPVTSEPGAVPPPPKSTRH